MHLLDLSKKRDVTFNILGNNEEIFEYTGIVNSAMIDTIEKGVSNIEHKIKTNQNEMSLKEMTALKIKLEKKMVELFFGDDIGEYKDFVKRNKDSELQIHNFVYSKINSNIEEVKSEMVDKDKSEDESMGLEDPDYLT